MTRDMNCIACGNSKLSKYSENSYMNLPIHHCPNCGLYATGNSESEVRKKSKEIYEQNYWDEREAEFSLKSNYTDINSQGKRRQWISQIAYCGPFLENKKNILEIGTGPGQTTYWFEQSGYVVTGIEPDSRNVALINQKLKKGHCITGYAEEVSLNETFDVIWSSHVFEHMIRPDLLLKKYKENLKEDGVFFIEIPNCENNVVLQSSIADNPSNFHFSKKSLVTMIEKAGYEVIKCDYFRSPNLLEGAINKTLKKYFYFLNFNIYPYYPKLISDSKNGTDIRIIFRKQVNHIK